MIGKPNHNPWGFDPNDGPPNPAEMFPPVDEFRYVFTDTLEDFLQHNGVFINGISGKKAHQDSYMTIVDPQAVVSAVELLVTTYAPEKEMWQAIADHFRTAPNISPPLKLFALYLVARFDLTPPGQEHSNEGHSPHPVG